MSSAFQIGAFQTNFQPSSGDVPADFGAVLFLIAPFKRMFRIAPYAKTFVIRR